MNFSGTENNISSAGKKKKRVFQGEIWNKHFSSKINVLTENIPFLFLSLKKEKQNDSLSGNVTLSRMLLFHSKKKKKVGIWHFKAKQKKKLSLWICSKLQWENWQLFDRKDYLKRVFSWNFVKENVDFSKRVSGKRRYCSLGIGCSTGTSLKYFHMIVFWRWAFLLLSYKKKGGVQHGTLTKILHIPTYIGVGCCPPTHPWCRRARKQKWRELHVLFPC